LTTEPEKAFAVGLDCKHDFETWMISVYEYKKILQSLYERGYVLVKMADLLEGRVEFKKWKILLVILSYDDVNYYEYIKGDGFADRTVINELMKRYPEIYDTKYCCFLKEYVGKGVRGLQL